MHEASLEKSHAENKIMILIFDHVETQPEQVLIQLPHSSLLNKATISPLYPSIKPDQITAYQLLAIHLSLNRHKTSFAKGHPEAYIPYMRTLPQDFDTVPLWREVVKDAAWSRLSQTEGVLPYGLKAATTEVSQKFWKDWTAVQVLWVRKKC